MEQVGKNKFLIWETAGTRQRSVERFGKGGKGNPYVFIETSPKTERLIGSNAFKAVSLAHGRLVQQNPLGSSEMETLKLQRICLSEKFSMLKGHTLAQEEQKEPRLSPLLSTKRQGIISK